MRHNAKPDDAAMSPAWSRRDLWRFGAPLGIGCWLGATSASAAPVDTGYATSFPSQPAEKVRAVVGEAHRDADAVRRLVSASPALANAAIDWGFGDWESAIGAAAHMGRRDIAAVLLEHGARPDLFLHAMLGHLAAVEQAVTAMPGIQGCLGPHGLTLLHHARAGGEASRTVVEYLDGLGGADDGARSAPLERQHAAYLGRFAAGDEVEFEIVEQQNALALRRHETFGRTLFHLGDDVFHPVGAPAVRVGFAFEDGAASRVTVRDAELEVVALRVPDDG